MVTLAPEAISRAYNNRLLVPHFMDIIRLWDSRSEASRQALHAQGRLHLDQRYGPHELQTLDVVRPAPGSVAVPGAAPVLVFIHGGYWRMMDKSAQTFIGQALSERGAVVALPNYRLAPSVTLQDISLDVAQAVAWVWRHAAEFGGDPSRIVVAGHSAGGHLTAMALSCLWPKLQPGLPAGLVRRGVAISGLFDLAPLQHCEWLMPDIRLTPPGIAQLSPVGWRAPRGVRMDVVAGALESSEFHRQNELIEAAWGRAAVPLRERIAQRNHFDILLDLEDPGSRLSVILGQALGLFRGGRP